MTIETAPPMAHAVGGSLGSALALLLLYPLERARVELQTIAAAANSNDDDDDADDDDDNTTATTTMTKGSPGVAKAGSRSKTTSDTNLSEDINKDKVNPLLLPRPPQQKHKTTARGGGGGILAESEMIPPPKRSTLVESTTTNNKGSNNNISASVSEEESWESCRHRTDSVGDITSSSSSSSADQQEVDGGATTATINFATRHPDVLSLEGRNKEPTAINQQQQKPAQGVVVERKRKNNKLPGLLNCIYQLHQRNQLYKGVAPVVTTMAASNFVFFYMHSFLKQWLVKLTTATATTNHPNQQHSALSLRLSLLASTLAGICNVLLTNPMWVANLRIVTKKNGDDGKKNNLFQEMKSIAAKEGWAHLWNGTPASLLLVSNPVIQFVAYEQLKNRLLQSLGRRHNNNNNNNAAARAAAAALRPLEAFVLGAIAKAISTVLTYPLQLTQTVLRVQKQEQEQDQEQQLLEDETTTATSPTLGSSSPPPPQQQQQQQQQLYRGTLDCLIKIYQQKGMEGWFAGMKTKLLQTVLTAAFTFLTYEQIIRAIMAVHKALQEGSRRGGVRPNHHNNHGRGAGAPVP